MSITFWDALLIAALQVGLLLILIIVLSFFAAVSKQRRQKKEVTNEIYKKLEATIQNEQDFQNIIDQLTRDTRNDK